MIDIVSIGQAAAWTQASVTWIRRAAEELGIAPAFRINGVDHFHSSDLDRMRPCLEAMRTKVNRRHLQEAP